MKLGTRQSLLVIAMVLLVGIMGWSFRWDLRNRIRGLETLMIDQAGVVSDIVAEANWHGLQTYQEWEKEFAARLLDDARWLGWEADAGHLDPARLSDLAGKLSLNRVLILGPKGKLQLDGGRNAGSQCLKEFPADFLDPLVQGTRRQAVLGFQRRHRIGCSCYVVGVARPEGGAVVVDAVADSLLSIRREIGPGHLLKSIGEGRSVKFVVIQDETGIQASSTSALGFLSPAEDPYLKPLIQGQPWVSREYDSKLGRVFEVARVVSLYGGDAVLRVGLDAAPLVEMRRDIRHRTIMRAIVMAAGLVLLGALLMAWQRQGVLDREVARARRELAAKEEESRRMGKLVAMGSLAAGVAHQIRNPLNSIHMIAQLLGRKEGLDPQVRDKARHIQDESARIEHIVQEFLDFARPRAPVPEKVDLAGLVRDVVEVQAAAHADRDVVLSAYAPGLFVHVDRGFITEILENLIRNAVAAVGEGGKILVSLVKVGSEAEIVVEDNGPGVPTAERDRIFDLYYTTRPEGTGLGLSLAARMASALGGSLELDTAPGLDGKGARFVVRLPLKHGAQGRTSP